MVRKMKAGAVVVDVAIDQGGCFETSKPTTHTDPTFIVDGVLHYCVANMPGAVARTSTFALTNATYPFIEALANRGMVKALSHDHHLRNGLSVHRGQLTSEPVAKAQRVDFVLAEELLAA
jgi:alanine dehydrogenase